MYCSFFGFREKPFNVTPDPRFLYLNPAYQEALAALAYGINERRGFVCLIGEAGTGKTTLLRRLIEGLEPRVKTVLVLNPSVSFEEMLEYILGELGLPVAGRKLAHLQRLSEFLIEHSRSGGNVALLIDEAQDLDISVLEDLRLLSNLETAREKILQIILSGQPELEAKINDHRLRQLKQRVNVNIRLRPLTRTEVAQYVRRRLAVAGATDAKIFTREAVDLTARLSRGIPRVINVLCDGSLMLGFAAGKRRITAEHVREAWHDFSGEPAEPSPVTAGAPEPQEPAAPAEPSPAPAAAAPAAASATEHEPVEEPGTDERPSGSVFAFPFPSEHEPEGRGESRFAELAEQVRARIALPRKRAYRSWLDRAALPAAAAGAAVLAVAIYALGVHQGSAPMRAVVPPPPQAASGGKVAEPSAPARADQPARAERATKAPSPGAGSYAESSAPEQARARPGEMLRPQPLTRVPSAAVTGTNVRGSVPQARAVAPRAPSAATGTPPPETAVQPVAPPVAGGPYRQPAPAAATRAASAEQPGAGESPADEEPFADEEEIVIPAKPYERHIRPQPLQRPPAGMAEVGGRPAPGAGVALPPQRIAGETAAGTAAAGATQEALPLPPAAPPVPPRVASKPAALPPPPTPPPAPTASATPSPAIRATPPTPASGSLSARPAAKVPEGAAPVPRSAGGRQLAPPAASAASAAPARAASAPEEAARRAEKGVPASRKPLSAPRGSQRAMPREKPLRAKPVPPHNVPPPRAAAASRSPAPTSPPRSATAEKEKHALPGRTATARRRVAAREAARHKAAPTTSQLPAARIAAARPAPMAEPARRRTPPPRGSPGARARAASNPGLAALARGVSYAEAKALVARFRQSYQRRDLASLMELFAPDASENGARGRARIRQRYQATFAALRDIRYHLGRLSVQRGPDGAVKLAAPFAIAYTDRGGLPREVRGHVAWEIERRGGEPRISALSYSLSPAP